MRAQPLSEIDDLDLVLRKKPTAACAAPARATYRRVMIRRWPNIRSGSVSS